MEKIKNLILNKFLQGTWHICKHKWECKAVELDGTADYLCELCGVSSRVISGHKVILVNSDGNHPFKLEPWQINKKNAKGISISI